MRVAKRLNGEEISQDEIYEQEQRCALGRLRGEGKHGKVGSVRVGTGVVTSSKPGVLRPSTQVDRLALKPSNNAGIDIFTFIYIFCHLGICDGFPYIAFEPQIIFVIQTHL